MNGYSEAALPKYLHEHLNANIAVIVGSELERWKLPFMHLAAMAENGHLRSGGLEGLLNIPISNIPES